MGRGFLLCTYLRCYRSPNVIMMVISSPKSMIFFVFGRKSTSFFPTMPDDCINIHCFWCIECVDQACTQYGIRTLWYIAHLRYYISWKSSFLRASVSNSGAKSLPTSSCCLNELCYGAMMFSLGGSYRSKCPIACYDDSLPTKNS